MINYQILMKIIHFLKFKKQAAEYSYNIKSNHLDTFPKNLDCLQTKMI